MKKTNAVAGDNDYDNNNKTILFCSNNNNNYLRRVFK